MRIKKPVNNNNKIIFVPINTEFLPQNCVAIYAPTIKLNFPKNLFQNLTLRLIQFVYNLFISNTHRCNLSKCR